MKNAPYLFYLVIMACDISLASCKKSEAPSPPITMHATVNGKPWTASHVTSRYDILGTDITLVMIGQIDSSDQSIVFHIENYAYGKGIINLEATHVPTPNITADAVYNNNSFTVNIAASGQIDITNVSGAVIQGTFNFKAAGATVSDGSFTVATPQQ